jgi:hypothetical protein
VLSVWSELADANMDGTNVDLSKVDRLDQRTEDHSWNQAGVITRPTTPTQETTDIIKCYRSEYFFLKQKVCYANLKCTDQFVKKILPPLLPKIVLNPPPKRIMPPPVLVKKAVVVPTVAPKAGGSSRRRPISASIIETDSGSEDPVRLMKKQKKTMAVAVAAKNEPELVVSSEEEGGEAEEIVDETLKVYQVHFDL